MKRSSGILLHPTSLPSPYGIGDFGPRAYEFVDFLAAARQRVWAVLPLTIPDFTNSPYASVSAMALNWFLVSPDQLVRHGLLDPADKPNERSVRSAQFGYAYRQKRALLETSYRYFQSHASATHQRRFKQFIRQEKSWLESYVLYMAIKEAHRNKPWWLWPAPLARHTARALRQARKRFATTMDFFRYEQWVTQEQWLTLKDYANKHGVKIFGDIPFFVTHDSVDVWAQQSQYLLNTKHQPTVVSGVPPDYFSRRGQIWNNPHYNWEIMERDHFRWWRERINRASELYDFIRLDHFRGFCAIWHIPAGARTARHGEWVSVPGRALFAALKKDGLLGTLIAEDLGSITPDVTQLRTELKLPGMRVMQFGFSGFPDNYHRPQNFTTHDVAYTGTHDNDTSRGWFTSSGTKDERWYAGERLHADATNFTWKLMRAGMQSPAWLFITPMQDVLNLGSEARMNTPGTKRGNWRWRCTPEAFSAILSRRLARLTASTKR